MKPTMRADGRPVLGVFPASGEPPDSHRAYLPITPAQLRANLTRFITLSGRKPGVALLYQVGYDPRGVMHFPVDLCRVCWEEFEAVPLVIQIPAWNYDWLASAYPDFTIEGILAGQASARLTAEARRCAVEYGGPVIIAPSWEDPNIGDPAVQGDGWPYSRNAELIQQAAFQGRAPMTDLDGHHWWAGPADYIRAKRTWIDAWRQGNPEALFLHQTCAQWGGPDYTHPKWWCPGRTHTDILGGQAAWFDLGGGTYYALATWLEDMVREMYETEQHLDPTWHPSWFLEFGGPEIQGNSTAKAFQIQEFGIAINENRYGIRDRIDIIEYWDDWVAADFQGDPPWQNATYGIDSSRETLAAFQELVRDEKLFASTFDYGVSAARGSPIVVNPLLRKACARRKP